MEAATETLETNGSGKNSGLTRQLIAVIIVSLGTVNAGMIQGWMSPMTKILTSSDSPVGPLDSAEIGFVASLTSYVALVCGFMVSYSADRFGRKSTLIIFGFPSLLGGILFVFSNTKIILYIARGLSGFSMVGISLGPMYLSETIHESIRGTLITFSNLAISVGILLSYSAYKYLDYKVVNYILIGEPALYLGLLFLLPETPHYLSSKSRSKAALKSLLWLRGGNVECANAELKNIEIGGDEKEKLTFVQSFKTKEARAALVIGALLYALQTLSGIHIILSYAEMIFTDTKSPISPDSAALFIPVTGLIATIVCLMFVDKIGRLPLLYISVIVGFISHLSLSILLLLLSQGHMFTYTGTLTVICLTSFVFSYGLGMGGVPALVLNEVASVEIKSYLATVAIIMSIGLIIGVLQLFPILTASVGIYVNFLVPATSNFLGIFLIWRYVPETKGKSLTEITNILKGR